MDPVALLASANGMALRRLCSDMDIHCHGLSVAARLTFRRGFIDLRMRKLSTKLDDSFSFVKHITTPKVDSLQQDLHMMIGKMSFTAPQHAAKEGDDEAEENYAESVHTEPCHAEPDHVESGHTELGNATLDHDEPNPAMTDHAVPDSPEMDHAKRPAKMNKGETQSVDVGLAALILVAILASEVQSYSEELTNIRCLPELLADSGECNRAEQLKLEDRINLLEADVLTRMSRTSEKSSNSPHVLASSFQPQK